MATTKLFDAETQSEQDFDLSKDPVSGELLATSPSGRVLKFPSGLSRKDFDKLVAEQVKANEGQEVISPEEAQAAEDRSKATDELISSFED